MRWVCSTRIRRCKIDDPCVAMYWRVGYIVCDCFCIIFRLRLRFCSTEDKCPLCLFDLSWPECSSMLLTESSYWYEACYVMIIDHDYR